MKVILNQTVDKLGKAGTVVVVADGYARNYLFPRKIATLADKNQLKVLARRQALLDAKAADTKAAAEATKEKIDGQTLKIVGKVGKETGKLFGAITSQDIADMIAKELGVKLEKKQVALLEPIKKLGFFPILIDLHRDVDARVTINVYDPDAPVVLAPVVEVVEDVAVEEVTEMTEEATV